MSFFITFLVFFYPSLVNLLVISKIDQTTLFSYYNKLRAYTNVQSDVAFSNRDLFNYCHELRQASTFVLITSEDVIEPPGNNLNNRVISKSDLIFEKNQVGLRVTKFKLKNFSQPVIRHAFQCLDFDSKLTWFITPGFIPDSAFLFTYASNFHETCPIDLQQQNIIPAHLTAIIDEAATEMDNYPQEIDSNQQIMNLPMNFQGNQPLPMSDPIMDTQLYLEHKIISYYQLPGNPEDSCTEVKLNLTSVNVHNNLEPKRNPEHVELIVRKLLHCHLWNREYEVGVHLYATLSDVNQSKVIYFATRGEDSTRIEFEELDVPLLKHRDKYSTV